MFRAREASTGSKLKLDERRADVKFRAVKMVYNPEAREGDGAEEITFADLEYTAANDNDPQPRRAVALFAGTFFALAFSVFYWLMA